MKNTCVKFIAILTALSLSFVGCDKIYGLLQREGAEEKSIIGEIIPFADNEKVKEVQELLKVYGFNPGKIDGRMGQKTRDALEEFQNKNNLKPTRFVDKRTWAKLNVIKKANLVLGDEINIKTVQFILSEAGLDPGTIDGKMGRKTKAALKEFQKSNGLKPDGVVGRRTLQKLIDYLPAQ